MTTGNKVSNYLSLVKFSHTIFAMPFAFVGYFLAVNEGYQLNWVTLLLIVLCMVFARNAAMSFNRYADREIDGKNPRTALREIPAGIIKPGSALRFVLLNCVAFIVTTALINPLVLCLAPVALLVVLGYSLTKRFTSLCHFILGLGLSLAPIGAFLAVAGRFEWLPVIFSFIVLCWTGGFDIIYAMQDEHFDKSQNLKSMPAFLGGKRALWLSSIVHVLCVLLVIVAGFEGHFRTLYWIGAAVYTVLLIWQHLLVKPNDLSRVNLAFGTVNGIASVIFATFTIADMLIG
jgi:putative 4-hydroxybenzoate polyprenyltransferase